MTKQLLILLSIVNTATAAQLYWSEGNNIVGADADGSNASTIYTNANGVNSIFEKDDTIYYTSFSGGSVSSVSTAGTGHTQLASGINSPTGLYVTNDFVYGVTYNSTLLYQIALSGPTLSTLQSSIGGQGVDTVFDAGSGKIFLSTRSNTIKTYDVNTSSFVDVYSSGTAIQGLSIYNSKLYFSDVGAGEIKTINLDGTGETTLATGLGNVWDLDVTAGGIYFTDLNNVKRRDLDGTNETTLHSGSQIWSIQSNTVPEPTSTTLLGLGGLALILRRKK